MTPGQLEALGGERRADLRHGSGRGTGRRGGRRFAGTSRRATRETAGFFLVSVGLRLAATGGR